ncbi:MAG: DUF4911 domain-containing protein [Mariprofundus sp.]|nr:DUF4911 domain-containing protein [Mariprofundus sp.]
MSENHTKTHGVASRHSQTLIVEFVVAPRQSVLFQSILQGEDGLGVVRCFDPEKKKQQLWTSADQKNEVYDWLNSLPEHLNVEVTGEWYFE